MNYTPKFIKNYYDRACGIYIFSENIEYISFMKLISELKGLRKELKGLNKNLEIKL